MTDNLTMTLAEIRYHQPCEDGWRTLLASLDGARTPLATRVSLGDIARSSSAAEAWWSVRALDWSDETVRRRVVSVLLLTVRRAAAHTTDERVRACVDAIQRWCDGDDSVDLRATRAAAGAAAKARAADAAAAAAKARAAARAAADAAWAWPAAAADAAAAAEAAEAAAWAAEAEAAEARTAAWAAAWAVGARAAGARAAWAAEARAELEQQRADLIAAFPPLHGEFSQ
jgi:hypothetical protein